jgi:hypothetical protein
MPCGYADQLIFNLHPISTKIWIRPTHTKRFILLHLTVRHRGEETAVMEESAFNFRGMYYAGSGPWIGWWFVRTVTSYAVLLKNLYYPHKSSKSLTEQTKGNRCNLFISGVNNRSGIMWLARVPLCFSQIMHPTGFTATWACHWLKVCLLHTGCSSNGWNNT